jgi:hypothetical protein
MSEMTKVMNEISRVMGSVVVLVELGDETGWSCSEWKRPLSCFDVTLELISLPNPSIQHSLSYLAKSCTGPPTPQ